VLHNFSLTKPPISVQEIGECFQVVRLPEIRPERVGEEELGVGRLPQQEGSEPKLAADSDKQVWVREVVC
jgi:hypothetical protein